MVRDRASVTVVGRSPLGALRVLLRQSARARASSARRRVRRRRAESRRRPQSYTFRPRSPPTLLQVHRRGVGRAQHETPAAMLLAAAPAAPGWRRDDIRGHVGLLRARLGREAAALRLASREASASRCIRRDRAAPARGQLRATRASAAVIPRVACGRGGFSIGLVAVTKTAKRRAYHTAALVTHTDRVRLSETLQVKHRPSFRDEIEKFFERDG